MPYYEFILAAFAAFILGFAKAGLKGVAIIIVTLMALAFGAKESTGVLLPLLIIGDMMAVTYYNRHAQWKILIRFLPWMVLGVLVGVYLGKELNELVFKKWMSIIIITSVIMMFWWESKPQRRVPKNWWFAGITGSLAGFTTMIGNLAGAFSDLYFLAMRIPKDQIIGTGAWLFFIINLFKVPFHIFSWHTINKASLLNDLYLIPFVIIGFILGVRLVSIFKEKAYRRFILIMTALAAIVILLN